MKFIAIITAKILILLGKILKRGSSLPGKVALKIDKKILSKLTYPNIKVVVTGSAGKGSTTNKIAKTLKLNGKTVCFNEEGSNLAWGVTTSLLRFSTLTGKIKTEYLVLEIDERYTKECLKYILPDYVVITNLTKDQPPRQHYIDNVYHDLISSIPKNSKIITLMDEALLRNIENDLPNEIIYFGLAQNKYSYKTQIFENLTSTFCPKCDSPLIYDYYNFENLGSYKCSKCSFKYLEPKTLGQDIDLEKEEVTIDNEKISIGGDMLYDVYNTISTVAVLKELGMSIKDIKNSLAKLNGPKKDKFFKNSDKLYRYFSCKSENAPTFNQALYKISMDQDEKDIIIGWNIISKRYPHTDVSWLYDIEFELLNSKNTNKIYVLGMNRHDLKTRFILAGIPEDKIIEGNNIPEIKDKILNSPAKKIYCMSHYEYGAIFKNTFKEEK